MYKYMVMLFLVSFPFSSCPNEAIEDLLSEEILAIDIFDDSLYQEDPVFRFKKQKVHVVCSAALIPHMYEQRKRQYIRSLKRISQLGYQPYVVESCVAGPTFFDEYSSRVFYSRSNDSSLKNKGVNESVSMLKAFEAWNDIDDNDMILKLTGRYYLQSDKILRFLENNPQVDALAKFEKMERVSVLTGCFAMKFGLFKEMLRAFDYDKMERELICVEHEVGPYLNMLARQGKKVVRVENLGVEANVFGFIGSHEHDVVYW